MKRLTGLLCLLLVSGCIAQEEADEEVGSRSDATTAVGSTSTLLSNGTFTGPFAGKRKVGEWELEIRADTDTAVAVQEIVFQPGGHSGWHSHPGPVFITVKTGTMTFYEAPDCVPIVLEAGQGFLDNGEPRTHAAVNETSAPATNVVVYMSPVGAVRRIDRPQPDSPCPVLPPPQP